MACASRLPRAPTTMVSTQPTLLDTPPNRVPSPVVQAIAPGRFANRPGADCLKTGEGTRLGGVSSSVGWVETIVVGARGSRLAQGIGQRILPNPKGCRGGRF